jgi:hypothetical protein
MESPLAMPSLARLWLGCPLAANVAGCARLFLGCLVVILALLPATQAQEKPQPNVLTAEDLVRLSKEDVGDELIIELVRAADELPNLTPQDVIELRQAGVSANVLTAVFQKRNATTTPRPEIAGVSKRRRIRIAAVLEPQKRSLLGRFQEKDALEQIQVSWGAQAHAWDDRAPIDLAASPNCPQDSFCRRRDPVSGECLEAVEAGSSAWKEQFGCYADARLTKFGAEYPVFELELPETAADVRIMAFFRSDDALVPWFTRGAENNTGNRIPGQLRVQLYGSEDFDLDLQVRLLMSPGGYVQDLQIGQCQVVNRDDTSMERRILSQNRQYCHVEEARLGR